MVFENTLFSKNIFVEYVNCYCNNEECNYYAAYQLIINSKTYYLYCKDEDDTCVYVSKTFDANNIPNDVMKYEYADGECPCRFIDDDILCGRLHIGDFKPEEFIPTFYCLDSVIEKIVKNERLSSE